MTNQVRIRLNNPVTTISLAEKLLRKEIRKQYPLYIFVSWFEKPHRYESFRQGGVTQNPNSFGSIAKLRKKESQEHFYVRAGINGVIMRLSKPRSTNTSFVEKTQ